ncbi:MAG: hypothetical protein MUP19_01635, partial [Candidatus Aminicenantes bacterium]|nr:hypothetical protein [Candidatus Aminicenantes bacterium]
MGSRTFFLAWVVVAIAFSLPGCTDATRGGGAFGSVPDPDRSPFPNLIENGDFERYDPHSKPGLWLVDAAEPWVWDEFSAGAGRRSLFIDASMIGQASPVSKQVQEGSVWATAGYRLRDLKPDTAYILEISFFKDRNIDGVYPVVKLAGRTFRLSDLWGSGKWKRISLIFKTPPESGPVGGPPGANPNRLLSIKIPAGDYCLWLDDLTLREFRIEIGREALPDRGAAVPISFSPGSIAWAFPATDRLIDFRVVLAASRAHVDSRDPAAVVLETNNAAAPSGGEAMGVSSSHLLATNLDLAKISRKVGASVYFRVEARQYNKYLAVSKIGKIKIPPAAEAGTAAALAAAAPSASTQAQALLSPADFFPIGIYGAGLDDFEALRRAGFNTIVFAARSLADLNEGVTKAKKLGLKLIVSPDVFMGTTDTTEEARSNPPPPPLDPILAWYLDDEP